MRVERREQAIARIMQDFRERSLAPLGCQMAQLICVSSTRDYNTGRYEHEGLSWGSADSNTDMALRALHQEIFEGLIVTPLEGFADDLEVFFNMTMADRSTAVRVWQDLEPYRTAIPEGSSKISRELFFSNIRMALALLQYRQTQSPPDQPVTLQRL
jgi:hypothetical protein